MFYEHLAFIIVHGFTRRFPREEFCVGPWDLQAFRLGDAFSASP